MFRSAALLSFALLATVYATRTLRRGRLASGGDNDRERLTGGLDRRSRRDGAALGLAAPFGLDGRLGLAGAGGNLKTSGPGPRSRSTTSRSLVGHDCEPAARLFGAVTAAGATTFAQGGRPVDDETCGAGAALVTTAADDVAAEAVGRGAAENSDADGVRPVAGLLDATGDELMAVVVGAEVADADVAPGKATARRPAEAVISLPTPTLSATHPGERARGDARRTPPARGRDARCSRRPRPRRRHR